MVQRDYNAPNLAVQDTRSIQDQQVAQTDTRAVMPIQVGDSGWRDKLMSSLLSDTTKGMLQRYDVEKSNAFLDGQAAAAIGQSEAELQSDPLTRDWKVAGYRDTIGKLALADSEAQFQNDIQSLREQGPEEFQQYLTARRNKLMPGINSMDRESRVAATGQLLLQDRAATKTWQTEHTKFILEQKQQAITTQWATNITGLRSAQIQAEMGQIPQAEFKAHMDSAAGMLVGSVWLDKSLPDSVKQSLTFGMLENGLSKDVVSLYDYANNTEVVGGGTLVSRLTADQQLKLSNQYRDAMQRTRDTREFVRFGQLAQMEAQIKGGTYSGSWDDINTNMHQLVMNKVISADRAEGILKNYLDMQSTQQSDGGLYQATLRGDLKYIQDSGKTAADGMAVVDKMLAKNNAPTSVRLSTYMSIGAHGFSEGYKAAGAMLGVAARQLRSPDGKVLPQHLASLETINAMLHQVDAAGQDNARIGLLSGVPEADRTFVDRVLTGVNSQHMAWETAVQRATELETQEAKMPPSARAAMAQQAGAAVNKAIASLTPVGDLSYWTSRMGAAVGLRDPAETQLAVRNPMDARHGYLSTSPNVDFYTNKVRSEIGVEAGELLKLNPMLPPEQVVSQAKAGVAARTIQTRYGPLVLPHGVNAGQVFGVGGGNVAAIGPALDQMLHETKSDSSWQLTFTNGKLVAQEMAFDGVEPIGNPRILNPQDVRAAVQSMTDKQQKQAGYEFGNGKTVTTPDGKAGITFNGVNTAGVPNDWMFKYRENLVKHEGIRDEPYRDLSGNKDSKGNPIFTVGVGVSSHNPRYPKVQPDGSVLPQDIQHSFTQASNDAAIAGASIARGVGIENASSFALFSEVAYQSGTGFMKQKGKTGDYYRGFVAAMQTGNVEAAQAAFKHTAAWYYSADPADRSKVTPRQSNYLRLIADSLK